MATVNKSSAELEAEVRAQRNRLDARVAEIQERLSPGQLLDEALRYARSNGGAEFVSNLGTSVRTNPLPVALSGLGLAWLMASSAMPASREAEISEPQETTPNFAKVSGPAMRRIGQTSDAAGRRYTEFTDNAGSKFKALSDDLGRRAGHFTDETGQAYHGFVNESGSRVRDFLDEAGGRLDDAQGWAAEKWEIVQSRGADIGSAVGETASNVQRSAMRAGGQVQQQASAMGGLLGDILQRQPLIGAALAFAAGAAAAAVLPRLPQEDELMGEAADKVKAQGAQVAAGAYQEGKRQLADTYGEARDKVGKTYDRLRDDIAGGSGSTMTH